MSAGHSAGRHQSRAAKRTGSSTRRRSTRWMPSRSPLLISLDLRLMKTCECAREELKTTAKPADIRGSCFRAESGFSHMLSFGSQSLDGPTLSNRRNSGSVIESGTSRGACGPGSRLRSNPHLLIRQFFPGLSAARNSARRCARRAPVPPLPAAARRRRIRGRHRNPKKRGQDEHKSIICSPWQIRWSPSSSSTSIPNSKAAPAHGS